MITRLRLLHTWLLLLPLCAPAATVSFEQDVRPILKEHCFHCHGEEKKLRGGLDLRLRKLILKGGKSGAAIELGHHTKSRLFELVKSGEMPPKKELRLGEHELEVIAGWIDAGAPVGESEPKEDPQPGEFIFTAAERNHWAFQPIRKPTPPDADKHPIDAFVAQRLTEQKLTPSPEADRVSLIRRASFDLLGLPPTAAEVDSFVKDSRTDAYERLIDRLLDSPHYGERWARHWLDVAGYADSEGYNDKDTVRDDAWHYRDYVIRSLNEDKRWDVFIREQLAGDEMIRATHEKAEKLANESLAKRDRLIATGFLRMGPDGSGSSPADPVVARNKVLSDTIGILSSSLLGMTVGCAECHHHRYEPIPQQDFYRLRAVLAPVYDTANWRMPKSRQAKIISAENRAKADELEKEASALSSEYINEMMRIVGVIFERELEKIPADKREFGRKAYETEASKRTPEQKAFLTEQYPALNVQRTTLHLFLNKYKDGKDLMKGYTDLLDQVNKIRAKKPKPDLIRVATEDPKSIPVTKVFYRGDHNSPEGDPIAPAGLSVVSPRSGFAFAKNNSRLPTTGRRLAYANYLTDGGHPLVARVLVNRFWMHHFGRGIVSTTEDFGLRGEKPTHPELLDWLAADFMEHGWRLKRLHKFIMTSSTYRQASTRRPECEAIDRDNRFLWRMPVRRLDAESLRDTVLAVSGRLNRDMFGAPVPVAADDGGLIAVGGGKISTNQLELKRSLYVQVRRSQPVAMLESFDQPFMEPNCTRRVSSTVPTQSLAMLNSAFVVSQSEAFAKRLLAADRSSDLNRVTQAAWKEAFGRDLPAEDATRLQSFVEAQRKHFDEQLKGKKPDEARHKALATLCQVLLAANEFLYVD